jgi:DNA polymerase-3 subunit delta'
MFDRLTGNQRAKQLLRRMLAERRVPNGMIFAGEEGVGKKLFAIELAKALNCRAPRGIEACDHCAACLRARFDLPPADDAEANKGLIWSEHADLALVRAPGRAILVQQIRELERETNFRPYEGKARVFLVEDADKLNEASSNAFLKTLEEAASTSYLILLTSRPAALLPTIRSRCQMVRFAPLEAGEIEEHLARQRKASADEARLRARLARGSLGRALSLNIDDYRQQRETMLGVLEALTLKPNRTHLLRVAEDLSDARRKDEYEPGLETLETLVHDLWLISSGAPDEQVVNDDLRARLAGISARTPARRAARWLSQIEELRRQLTVNINRKIATDALFLAMAES